MRQGRRSNSPELADAGMSQREIASAVGVNASTVNRDLSDGVAKRNGSVAKGNADPDPEEDLDGPKRPASGPKHCHSPRSEAAKTWMLASCEV